jgi:HTH-type transcriptional regulator / antitoxin HigA
MDIRPIRNDEDHETALREIERLWGAAPGSPDGDRLDVLATLVDRYEEERFPLPAADPVAVIRHVMDAKGYTTKDLAKVLGSQPRASEILSRKRGLSLEHIRKVSRSWNIPPSALIGEPLT